MIKTVKTLTLFLSVSTILSGCGPDSNLNQLFVNSEREDSISYLIERAEFHYDKGEIDEALKVINKATRLTDDSEEVGVLAGYINLSKAGIDPFQLAENLIDLQSSALVTTNSASSLQSLSSIVGITDAELSSLSSTSSINGTTILIPVSTTIARDGINGPAKLFYVNEAINRVCPYVNASARLADDSRHTTDACPPTNNETLQTGKSHYLWALAHLTEAIAFNTVVNYSNPGSDQTAFEEAVTALGTPTTNSGGFAGYITGATELLTVLPQIFPDSSTDSMVIGLFNDLQSVANGFANLPGIPAEITDTITTSINELNTLTENIGSATDEASTVSNQTEAFKQESVGTELSTIETQVSENREEILSQTTEQERTDFCTQWEAQNGTPCPLN